MVWVFGLIFVLLKKRGPRVRASNRKGMKIVFSDSAFIATGGVITRLPNGSQVPSPTHPFAKNANAPSGHGRVWADIDKNNLRHLEMRIAPHDSGATHTCVAVASNGEAICELCIKE